MDFKKIQLLPLGGFVLTGPGKTYTGRFSMYAIDLFASAVGVENYAELINKMAIGMSIANYAMLLKCALNDYNRTSPSYTTTEVMDIIDEVFGSIGNVEFSMLIGHAIGKVSDPEEINEMLLKAIEDEESAAETLEEKKSD